MRVSKPIRNEAEYQRWVEDFFEPGSGYVPKSSVKSFPLIVLNYYDQWDMLIEQRVYLKDFLSDIEQKPEGLSAAQWMAWSVLLENSEAAANALADYLQEKGL